MKPIDELTNKDVANVLAFSGGKDSTALLLYAIERDVDFQVVFADTGHEHQITYDYLEYIEEKLNVSILRVKADLSKRIDKKREYIKNNWGKERITNNRGRKHIRRALTDEEIAIALKEVRATGNPMEDLLRLNGRGPSPMEKFCSMELKQLPVMDQIYMPLIKNGKLPINWQGVRAQESSKRASYLPVEESDLGIILYRPILLWTHDEVFEMHKKHGIKWNPLYEMGMSRVGCMPCICAGKRDLIEINKRFPEVIDRVEELESILGACTRLPANRERGKGSFIPTTFKDNEGRPVLIREHIKRISLDKNHQSNWVTDWEIDEEDLDQCSAVYPIVCE